MGLVMQFSLLLMQVFAIAFALDFQESEGYILSPSPIEVGRSSPVHQRKSFQGNGPSPVYQPNVSDPSIVLPPLKSAPAPKLIKGLVPSFAPSTAAILAPYNSAPPPSIVQRSAPPMLPQPPKTKSSHEKAPISVAVAPVPVTLPVSSPALQPSPPQVKAPIHEGPVSVPIAFVPVASPPRQSQQSPPSIQPVIPGVMPHVLPVPVTLPVSSPALQPSPPQAKALIREGPVSVPIAFVPVASPPRQSQQSPPSIQPVIPGVMPPVLPAPFPSPPALLPKNPPAFHPVMPDGSPSISPDSEVSPISAPPPNINWKRYATPVAAPPNKNKMPNPFSPSITPPKGSFSVVPPTSHKAIMHSKKTHAPALLFSLKSPPKNEFHSPATSPLSTFYKKHHARNNINGPAHAASHPALLHATEQGPELSPAPWHTPKDLPRSSQRQLAPPPLNQGSSVSPSYSPFPSTASHVTPAPSASPTVQAGQIQTGPELSPAPWHTPKDLPRSSQRQLAPPPLNQGSSVSPSYSPFPSTASHVTPAPSASPTVQAGQIQTVPLVSPKISPSVSSPRIPKTPLLPPVLALPPPPPNEDCTSIVCSEPLTNTPPGSPCGCVWPMQIGLRLSVALYTFFPLVSELAEEIASGVFMKQSQVRIMGANVATEEPEKTVVLIDLVPLGAKFDNTTAYLTYERFWRKQVAINASFFGDYEVLYVNYPGLPPSPPSSPASIGVVDGGPYPGHDNNGRMGKPLGVDVPRRQRENELSGSVIAIIALSACVAVVLSSAIVWVLLFKCRARVCEPLPALQASHASLERPAGIAGSMIGSGHSSASLSFESSMATYTGSAKTFSSTEIGKATDNFDSSRVIGEGGFGRVYSGVLEDGTQVAVKIIKREDQQGGREFLAEVEMLSRLHHRNLVKLIGICTEEHSRCLVYELIPNGSVESHLHGVDKETAPLDWGARMKIALGAARGLAYLHEDSSPRVIHRDFKSSNILLEHDFMPKVADFGLARTALDEENRHISTRVMGTFGYVAPEYAMTGHLLVKSDVYSYGVVLLELLTGRKPVDMSQPPGEENLVAWARPLLTSKEGLESIIDSSLGSDVSFDCVAKVAAIASMCVQPEVSHRPFMGEVVQALKLVSNECDKTQEVGSRSCSQEDLSIDLDTKLKTSSGQLPDTLQSQYPISNYETELDIERGLSASALFSSSVRFGRQESGSFRRHSSSGPLRTRRRPFWQRIGRLSRGSVSEHGVALRLWPGSH